MENRLYESGGQWPRREAGRSGRRLLLWSKQSGEDVATLSPFVLYFLQAGGCSESCNKMGVTCYISLELLQISLLISYPFENWGPRGSYFLSQPHPCILVSIIISSVEFSHSVMSDSLWPHGLQKARPPCPSPTPRVYSNSCPLSQWCHSTILSSIVPFSSHLQSFPASGSLQMSQFFASGGQSIEVSASASVLPMNTQDWFPLGWNGWISLQSKGLSRVFSNTTVQYHSINSLALSSSIPQH